MARKPGTPEELKPQPGDHLITKPRFSAFFDTGLDALLRTLGVDTVVLAGTTTPNCVRSTCYDALSLNYNVAIVEDCTSSRSPEVQAANIADMEYIGAFVLACDEFCEDGLEDMPDTLATVERCVHDGDGAKRAQGSKRTLGSRRRQDGRACR